MKILKGLAIGLLSFLLFLSLSIFGIAFLLNQTILNPNFVTSQLDKLDVAALVEEIISEQEDEEAFSEELETALVNTITKLEAPVKEQLGVAIGETYDYLLGRKETPDLRATLGNTFLNSAFVASLMEELDLSLLAEELISEQVSEEEFPEELGTALVNTITELEPTIKERVSAAADPIFDYLLGESQSIDLALTLRNTFLSSDFVVSLVNELDISSLASEFLGEQLLEDIPEEMEFLVEHLDDIVAELEPTIKEELIAAADPILDYLLGESDSLNIEISLVPIAEDLEDTLKETLFESPPAALAWLPLSELEQYFDEHFGELTEMLPALELDETLFGAEVPAQIAEALAEAEEGLGEARQDIAEALAEAEERLEEAREYIGYFQLGYKLLIGFIVLLVLGIIFINRQVKSATRKLGIIFLTYGAIEYTGIFVTKYFIKKAQLPWTEILPSLEAQLPQLVSDFLSPLAMFSLGLLIGGVVLIAVSFVYPRWLQSSS